MITMFRWKVSGRVWIYKVSQRLMCKTLAPAHSHLGDARHFQRWGVVGGLQPTEYVFSQGMWGGWSSAVECLWSVCEVPSAAISGTQLQSKYENKSTGTSKQQQEEEESGGEEPREEEEGGDCGIPSLPLSLLWLKPISRHLCSATCPCHRSRPTGTGDPGLRLQSGKPNGHLLFISSLTWTSRGRWPADSLTSPGFHFHTDRMSITPSPLWSREDSMRWSLSALPGSHQHTGGGSEDNGVEFLLLHSFRVTLLSLWLQLWFNCGCPPNLQPILSSSSYVDGNLSEDGKNLIWPCCLEVGSLESEQGRSGC